MEKKRRKQRKNESPISPSEARFLLEMIRERYREQTAVKYAPGAKAFAWDPADGPPNYGQCRHLLEHLCTILAEVLPTVELIRCKNYRQISPSRRRITIIGKNERGEIKVSVSSYQLVQLVRLAQPMGEAVGGTALRVKASFLDGLYLYISKGRLRRETYRLRYPRLWVQNRAYLEQLIRGFRRQVNRGTPRLSLAFCLHQRLAEEIGGLDVREVAAGEWLFRSLYWVRELLAEDAGTKAFPVTFLRAVETALRKQPASRSVTQGRTVPPVDNIVLGKRTAMDGDPDRGWINARSAVDQHLLVLEGRRGRGPDHAYRAMRLLRSAHRAGGKLPWFGRREHRRQVQVSYRFLGLNCLARGSAGEVWLAWDGAEASLSVVRFVEAGLVEPAPTNGFVTALQLYQMAHEAPADGELFALLRRQLPRLRARGPHWYAQDFVTGGSLLDRWQALVGGSWEGLFPTVHPFPGVDTPGGWGALRDYFVASARSWALLQEYGLAQSPPRPDQMLLAHHKGTKNRAWSPAWCGLGRLMTADSEWMGEDLVPLAVEHFGRMLAHWIVGPAGSRAHLYRRIGTASLVPSLKALLLASIFDRNGSRMVVGEFADFLGGIEL
ncbi:MAG: hypothetical protein AAGN35_13930 [Bacteroidota bacterium]